MAGQSWDFLVDRSGAPRWQLVRHPAPPVLPAEGEILVELELLAMSANVATYVGLGQAMGYWDFFPAPEGWGRFPAWGIGRVAATSHAGFAVGERLLGFLPASSHLGMRPVGIGPMHFLDGSDHRRRLHPAYNYYIRLDEAALAMPLAWLTLLRPLFLASFLLNDHLLEAYWFGAEQLLLTSASSKTALGLAMLHQRQTAKRPKLIGLTSMRNADFVREAKLYDEVTTYEELQAARFGSLAVVDFAGDPHLSTALARTSGNRIEKWIAVGATHAEDLPAETERRNFAGGLFFAPDHLGARMAQEGAPAFEQRFAAALADFQNVASRWLVLRESRGSAQLAGLYDQLLRGALPAAEGHIFYP